jgi:hypothetical protein
MRSAKCVVLSVVLIGGCVDREVDSQVLGLGDASTPGKDSGFGTGTTFPTDDKDSSSGGSDGSSGVPEASSEDTGESDGSTSEPPEVDPSSGESTEGSTSSAEPPGNPAWSDCTSGEDCEGGVCFRYEQPAGVLLDATCTNECDDPIADCVAPGSGAAVPSCLSVAEGVDICVLQCSAYVACPDGMVCQPIDTNGTFNLCF